MKKVILAVLLVSFAAWGARVEQGDTSRKVYFVAVDSTDYVTRETSLSNSTAYYSIDGGAATEVSEPNIAAVDTTNMPGVFTFMLDVAGMTTLSAGVDEAELVVHIEADEMAPVTMVVEVFRGAADVVWDAARLDHTTAATTGAALSDAMTNVAGLNGDGASDFADTLLTTALAAYTTEGQVGDTLSDIETKVDTVDTVVDRIEADTEIIKTRRTW